MNPVFNRENMDPDGFWPYEKMSAVSLSTDPWKLGIDFQGSVVLWPTDRRFLDRPDVELMEFYRFETREMAANFQDGFCRLGQVEDDALHEYQNGWTYRFNWVSGTLAQVHVASEVAGLFHAGNSRQAWDAGVAFARDVRDASRTFWGAPGDVK